MKIWNRCCCCWPLRCVCNPQPEPATGSFTAVKYDQETRKPLAGAGYTLYQNGKTVASQTSDGDGKLTFTGLAQGQYTMKETTAPTGYELGQTIYQVAVDETGTVTIDGNPAANYSLYDTAKQEAAISFQKVDAATGQPLEDAVFSLPNGVVAISDSEGMVDFGDFGTGTYTIHEVTPPKGYAAEETDYTVEVTTAGKVLVDGSPLESFKAENRKLPEASPSPVINTVTEGADRVTGTGVPGAKIAVTLPDGTVISTTVSTSGAWSVSVPAGTTLEADQTIQAVQTEAGHSASAAASFKVQARTAPAGETIPARTD